MLEDSEEWAVIAPRYMDDGEPEWLIVCEDQGHATRVYVGLASFGLKVRLVSRERTSWSDE